MENDLFKYLKNILYNPKAAELDISSLPEAYKKLGCGLKYLHECVLEQQTFTKSLSSGKLAVPLPASDNPITGELRALHGSMSHLVWQANQIANGDYSQRLDFMGEISDIFNVMIGQLESRELQLVEEINTVIQKNHLLKQSQTLLATLTENTVDWVCVLNDNAEFYYFNKSCKIALDSYGPESKGIFASKLLEAKSSTSDDFIVQWQLPTSSIIDISNMQYFSLKVHDTNWENTPAYLCILKNITAERESAELAYTDPLTGLHNRRYALKYIGECINVDIDFNIIFVDIDLLKSVNDTQGHEVGDEYIIETANHLKQLPQPCEVFRIGGDEFLVVSHTQESVVNQLETLRTFFVNTSTIYPRSFSFGVVNTSEGFRNISELLKIADSRMYVYKNHHKKMRQAQENQNDCCPV